MRPDTPTHPQGPWPRPRRFDRNLLVIGAGSAGLVAAYVAAALKARVTLVERERMGGDCLNTGCVPSKALIRAAGLAHRMRRAGELGLPASPPDIDFAQVMARVQRAVDTVAPHDSEQRYRALGVEVLRGDARLLTPWQVEITGAQGTRSRCTSRAIVVAAGARPLVPPIPGIEHTGYLTSDTLWQLRALPRRLLVLGGGPIGAELSQAFARLGSRVTLVERLPQLLAREDPEVSALLARRFADEGLDLRLGHQALRFEMQDGARTLIAEHQGRPVRIPFDTLLVAVGRKPNLHGYGLAELGIPEDQPLHTNAFLQTRHPSLYAAGDVTGRFPFTHTAAHQAWYAAVNALIHPFWRLRLDETLMPWTTFVDPEVARVGLNEQQAREQGIPHEVTRFDLAELDRAIVDDETTGFIKVLTPPGRDRILGVTLVAPHAGDLLAEWVLAMRHGIGLNKILGTIHVYPTLAEASRAVAGKWKREHAPGRLLGWAERFHRWRLG